MKRMIQYLPAVLGAILLLASCTDNPEMDPALLNLENGYVLEIHGLVIYQFTDARCQLTFNADRAEFRVGDDKMSDHYILTCNRVPSAKGDVVVADLAWSAGATVQKRSSLSFQVEKVAEDGRIWLWDSRDGIAVIVYKP